jgi:hypothetical protein
MQIITVPRPLREKLGEEATESLVELMNQATDQVKVDVIAIVEEKFERRLAEELAKVREEMYRLRSELKEDIAALHAKLAGEISALDARMERRLAAMEVQMAGLKVDIIRWMFLFWIGQLAAIIGILFAFLRK